MIDDSTNSAFQQCGIDTGGHFGLLVIHSCHAMTTHRPNTTVINYKLQPIIYHPSTMWYGPNQGSKSRTPKPITYGKIPLRSVWSVDLWITYKQ